MLTIVLAAMLSVPQVLPTLESFCTSADIEISRPLTEQMVSKRIVDADHQRVQGVIQNRYRFTCHKGKVKVFADLNENIHVRLTRLDPADMMRWSQEPCSMTETDALQMATRIFRRLGYSESDFDPPEAKRYHWIPSPVNPNRVFWLPVFDIRWYEKGSSREQAVPPHIEFIISGTTKRLIFFFDATRSESLTSKAITKLVPSRKEEQPSITLEDALPLCEPLLKAIGAQIKGPLQEHATLGAPDAWAKHLLGTSARPTLYVDERYIFEISFGNLREFNDFHERPICVLEVENPQRLQEMSQEKCSLDEKQALEIALRIFQSLGFRKADFYPPQVSRHVNRTSDFFGVSTNDFYWSPEPAKPGTRLNLPDSFWIDWAGKRLLDGLLNKQQTVIMEISGVTSNLIFYSHLP